jgi:hypothetical protein
MHDIDKGFESESHPGIMTHNSRGFQGDEEVNLMKKFIKNRSSTAHPSRRNTVRLKSLRVLIVGLVAFAPTS